MDTITQPAITGYRQLNPEEATAMNECKKLAVDVGALVEKLKQSKDYDQRWVSIATTQLQQGFMALVRSIAKPTTF